MEILIGLLLLWVLVTVVGHGSYVLLQRLFKGRSGQQPTRISSQHPTPLGDYEATRRIIDRLVGRELLTEQDADELRTKIDELLPNRLKVPHAPIASPPTPLPPSAASSAHRSAPAVALAPEDLEPESVPILAEVVGESVARASDLVEPIPAVAVAPAQVAQTPPEPPTRVLSFAEIIRSFLDARNIRWGELIAGMLIVICSIGLVRSLWYPLVETHRVIPSLIFLTANAAIYGAGLYTLSRWRLRHTSRAVLLIATLLVPLSVVAGLAAAGQGADAVLLSDPVTLVAIGIAAVIYVLLIRRGGRALLRRFYANPVSLAVAGQAAVMPFVPAAIRTLGANAGWVTGIGSIAVFMAVAIVLRRRPDNRTVGIAAGKAALHLLGVAGFTALVSIGYTGFALREFGREAIMPLAIAAIPTLVGLASLARSLQTRSRSGTQAMIGAAIGILLFAGAWTVLPAATLSTHWLWLWGAVFSLSVGVASLGFGQPRWLAIATLPIGTAVTLTSPVWLGRSNWADVGFWNRIFGGEPMLAMAGLALITGAVFGWLSRRAANESDGTKWIGFAAAFWGGAALLNASILSVAPPALLGDIPWWSTTGLLVLVAGVCWAVSSRVGPVVYGAIFATTFAWLSVFRPVTVNLLMPGELLVVAEPVIWMRTLAAIALSFAGLSELLPYFGSVWAATAKPTRRSSFALTAACAIAVTMAALLACYFARDHWAAAAATLGIGTALLLWSSIRTRLSALCVASQLASVALAVVVGCGYLGDYLVGSAAWQNAGAIWGWSIVGSAVVSVWLGIARLADWQKFGIRYRARHVAEFAKSPWRSPHGWVAVVSVTCVTLGTAWMMVPLLGEVLIEVLGIATVQGKTGVWVPVFALLAAGLSTAWMYRQEARPPRFQFAVWLPAVVGVTSVLWLSFYAATSLSLTSGLQLILATTLSVVGLAMMYLMTRRINGRGAAEVQRVALFTTTMLIGLSSSVLLLGGWIHPIQNGQPVDRASTLAVALWWGLAGIGSLWMCKSKRDVTYSIVSALLIPVTAVIVYPLMAVPSVPVGLQIAAIAAFCWRAAAWWWLREDEELLAGLPIQGAIGFFTVIGVTSALAAIGYFAFNIQSLSPALGFAGCLGSLIAIAYWCAVGLPNQPQNARITWQTGLSLYAGQAAWLSSFALGLVGPNQILHGVQILAGAWVVASIGSLVLKRIDGIALGHLGLLAIAITFVDNAVGSQLILLPWFALAAWASVGVAIVRVARDTTAGTSMRTSANLLGWLVVGVGTYLLVNRVWSNVAFESAATAMVLWSGIWVLIWRLANPDQTGDGYPTRSATPDLAWAFLIAGFAVIDVARLTYDVQLITPSQHVNPLLWTRAASYALVGLSTFARAGRRVVWALSFSKLASIVSMIAIAVAINFDASVNQRACSAVVSASFVIALLSHWLVPLTGWMKRFRTDVRTTIVPRVIESIGYIAVAIAAAGGFISVGMMFEGAPAADIHLTIISVALSTWALTVVANALDRPSARHLAVAVGLAAIGLLASVETGTTDHPTLSMSMRWLVASVVTIPFLMFLIPGLFGDRITQPWRVPLRRGAMVAAAAAVSSLGVMLVQETLWHTPEGISGISSPLVVGVAVTLSILSGLAGLIAILSGPTSKWRERFSLTDHQRIGLIVAAQTIGGITWLHVFLCRTQWAFAGLRGYWPYIVMLLAFLSVGATEWAARRRDTVLSNTLMKTALYLPLIPIIGFWFGGLQEFDWLFHRGRVRYDLMLAIGTVYYVGISALWKSVISRIAAVVLGNAAWWVVLVQNPGWEFLSHPQLWIIPPAACVLVVAHLYRDRLDPTVASAIRYGSTLVIYISSTADMLLGQIGQNLWGPVILILLALAGMAAGVVLRVRPFLYLGAIFVFMGVTSMVWHAQRSIDAVWPWWVFGITTGVCLLAGLMAIEKNKPKLKRYASQLATWQ